MNDGGIGRFGRSVKLKVGSTSIQPGWVVNNFDLDQAEFMNQLNYKFAYPQPLYERVLQFYDDSLKSLVKDATYRADKIAELTAFREKHSGKYVKAHAQVPYALNVGESEIGAWVDVQQAANLRVIEVLDSPRSTVGDVERAIKACQDKIKPGQTIMLGINTKNPRVNGILHRIEIAKQYGIEALTFYGGAKPTLTWPVIAWALQESKIFAQYAGINRITKVNPERHIELAHVAQAFGFNATSLRTIRKRQTKAKAQKRKILPPRAYDSLQWERVPAIEMIEKYKDHWPSDISHPIVGEKSPKEVYALPLKLRNAALYSFEAAEADYELRKAEEAIARGEYPEVIKEKHNFSTLVAILSKNYAGQQKL
ncbi:MAG: hypothetical protein WC861_02295 [Candidatus Micrarchaeia archaeon]|jgi:hypothetical protein